MVDSAIDPLDIECRSMYTNYLIIKELNILQNNAQPQEGQRLPEILKLYGTGALFDNTKPPLTLWILAINLQIPANVNTRSEGS